MPKNLIIYSTYILFFQPTQHLGQRIAGEGIPTTQSDRGLGSITTIPCPTPPAATTHKHGKGITCSTVSSTSKPR